MCLVLDLKSGGIALTLLGAGHSPQIQKNLPDPGFQYAETALVGGICISELGLVSVAAAFFSVFGPS